MGNMLNKTGVPSIVFGLSMAVLLAIVHLVVYFFTETFMVGLMTALGFALLSFVVTAVFTALTKKKEAMLAGFWYTFAILVLGGLIRMVLTEFVTPMIPALANMGL